MTIRYPQTPTPNIHFQLHPTVEDWKERIETLKRAWTEMANIWVTRRHFSIQLKVLRSLKGTKQQTSIQPDGGKELCRFMNKSLHAGENWATLPDFLLFNVAYMRTQTDPRPLIVHPLPSKILSGTHGDHFKCKSTLDQLLLISFV